MIATTLATIAMMSAANCSIALMVVMCEMKNPPQDNATAASAAFCGMLEDALITVALVATTYIYSRLG